MNIQVSKNHWMERNAYHNAMYSSLNACSCQSAFDSVWMANSGLGAGLHTYFKSTTNDFDAVKICNACPENLYFQLEISCHRSR